MFVSQRVSCRYLKQLKKKPKQLIKAVDKKRSDDHLLDSEEEIDVGWMLRAKGDQWDLQKRGSKQLIFGSKLPVRDLGLLKSDPKMLA